MNKETLIDGNKTILNTDFYLHLLSCENKKTNLEEALNEIREYCNNPFNWRYIDHYIEKAAVLQIIDKVLGDEK